MMCRYQLLTILYTKIISFSISNTIMPNTITLSEKSFKELAKLHTFEYIPLAYYTETSGELYQNMRKMYGMVINLDNTLIDDIEVSFVTSNEKLP